MNYRRIATTLFFVAVLTVALPTFGQQNLIFSDGFESGNTNAWSSTVSPSNVTITLINTSATSPVVDTNGVSHEEWGDYVVQFTLRAVLTDLYFEKEGARGTNLNLTKGFWFSIENGNGSAYNGGITPYSMSASCSCSDDTPTHFKVVANTTRTFWMSVRLDNSGGTTGSYRMRVTGLVYKLDGNNGDGTTLITTGLGGLVTSLKFVDNHNVKNLEGITSYEDFHLVVNSNDGHL